MVDHLNRKGPPYQPKRPLTDEERKIRSEAMKAFNQKTGRGTALGNSMVRRKRIARKGI